MPAVAPAFKALISLVDFHHFILAAFTRFISAFGRYIQEFE